MLRRRVLFPGIALLCVGAVCAYLASCGSGGGDSVQWNGGRGAGLASDSAERPPVAAPSHPVAAIDRAVIVSVDGLRPDLLARADAPNLRRLMRSGSFTLWASTTAASVTL